MLQNRIEALATAVANYLRDSVIGRLLPSGGTGGQVLTKTSATPYAANWQTPSGGGGGGVLSATVEINSTTPYVSKLFTAAVAGATVGQKVHCTVSLDMPAGVAVDELEDDPLTVSGRVSATDTVSLLVASVNGSPVGGKRNINMVIT